MFPASMTTMANFVTCDKSMKGPYIYIRNYFHFARGGYQALGGLTPMSQDESKMLRENNDA